MQRQHKITLGEMRESGPTRFIVHCADYKCAHSIVADASGWSDRAPVRSAADIYLPGLRPSGCRHPAVVRACRMGTG
jgi:hypothetical protein